MDEPVFGNERGTTRELEIVRVNAGLKGARVQRVFVPEPRRSLRVNFLSSKFEWGSWVPLTTEELGCSPIVSVFNALTGSFRLWYHYSTL